MEIFDVLLRVVHIFAGVFWVGAAWLLTFFLGPAAQALGPDGGKFMGYLNTRLRLSIYISVAAVLTVLAGWALYFMNWGMLWPDSKTITFAIGGVFGLIALGIGGGIVGPTSHKMTKLGSELASQGKPPTDEQKAQMGALQKRLGTASLWNSIVSSIALFLMAIARFMV